MKLLGEMNSKCYINRKFATIEENLVYFSLYPFNSVDPKRNVGFTFGVHGGNRDDMVTFHSNTQERREFLGWMKPKTFASFLNQPNKPQSV